MKFKSHHLKNLRYAVFFWLCFIPNISFSQTLPDDCFDNIFLASSSELVFNPFSEKRIKIKFHFIRNAEPFWGFSDQEIEEIVPQIIGQLNAKMQQNLPPSQGPLYPLWDFNLSFELVSTEAYDLDLCQQYFGNSFNVDPNAVNVFFEEHNLAAGDSCNYIAKNPNGAGGRASFLNLTRSFQIYQPYYRWTVDPYSGNSDPEFYYKVWADIIIHELGHNMGLEHNFGTPLPNICDDLFMVNVCTSNNFMDGCSGNKSTLTPCQISKYHNNLIHWSSINALPYDSINDPWLLAEPIFDTILFEQNSGMLFLGFNEDDYNSQNIEYCWSINGSNYTTNPIVAFNVLEHEGSTLNLCLHILDKTTGNLKIKCEDLNFDPLGPCHLPFNTDILLHYDDEGFPVSVQLGQAPLDNIFWSFQSESSQMELDNLCSDVPQLVYDTKLLEYQGDSITICAYRLSSSYGKICKNEICTTLFLPPKYPLCDDFNKEIGFEYYHFFDAEIDGTHYDQGVRLIGDSEPGILKYTWFNNQDNFSPEEKTGRKVVFERVGSTNTTPQLHFTLVVEDILNRCIVSRVTDTTIQQDCLDFPNFISYNELTNEVSVLAFRFDPINPDDYYVYLNDTRIYPEWEVLDDLAMSTTFELPSDCGKFNIFYFQLHNGGCINSNLTVEVGDPPCKESPEDPTKIQIAPNPSSISGNVFIEVEHEIDGEVQLLILDNFGAIRKDLSAQVSSGIHSFNVSGSELGPGIFHVLLIEQNNVNRGIFEIANIR